MAGVATSLTEMVGELLTDTVDLSSSASAAVAEWAAD